MAFSSARSKWMAINNRPFGGKNSNGSKTPEFQRLFYTATGLVEKNWH
jgi:hypothetical protein